MTRDTIDKVLDQSSWEEFTDWHVKGKLKDQTVMIELENRTQPNRVIAWLNGELAGYTDISVEDRKEYQDTFKALEYGNCEPVGKQLHSLLD
jgi:hypothetical protein